MYKQLTRRLLQVLLLACVIAIITGVLIGSASAQVIDHDTDEEEINIASHDYVVEDLTITISDVQITGSELPEKSVDEAEYTIENATLNTDGFTVTFANSEYRVGQITISIENVGIVVQDVSVGT